MEVVVVVVGTPAIMWSSICNAAFEIHTDIPRPANYDPALNPNFVSYIHPRPADHLAATQCISLAAEEQKDKNPNRKKNSLLRRGERERDCFWERKRKREGNEDKKRMVRGTTSFLEIIAAAICESTEWNLFGDRHGYSSLTCSQESLSSMVSR